jgi:ABC-type antimicrobial peptide transport system permease subunit
MSVGLEPGALAPSEPWATAASHGVIEHVSPTRAAVRRFLRHRLAIVGVFLVVTIMLLALLAPLLTPWAPNWIDRGAQAAEPGAPARHGCSWP